MKKAIAGFLLTAFLLLSITTLAFASGYTPYASIGTAAKQLGCIITGEINFEVEITKSGFNSVSLKNFADYIIVNGVIYMPYDEAAKMLEGFATEEKNVDVRVICANGIPANVTNHRLGILTASGKVDERGYSDEDLDNLLELEGGLVSDQPGYTISKEELKGNEPNYNLLLTPAKTEKASLKDNQTKTTTNEKKDEQKDVKTRLAFLVCALIFAIIDTLFTKNRPSAVRIGCWIGEIFGLFMFCYYYFF